VTVLPPALRERCWPPGQSGNPGGTGGEYQRCLKLCRQASHDAAEEIIRLSKESEDERVRFTAAAWVYERAWGKPREYDPSTEKAERPKFDPSLLSPQQRNQVEAALRLMAKAMRAPGQTSDGEGIDGHDR
jgi:hypothetical protein